jgi:hypothetical protein
VVIEFAMVKADLAIDVFASELEMREVTATELR